MSICSRRLSRSIAGAWILACLLVLPLHAATITIINVDGPNEGLNDPTPVAPVGGNMGTTLGQQRLLAAQFAADIWSPLLVSDVEIRVEFKFDPLGGEPTRAVLAFAGPTTGNFNFSGALQVDTVYVPALADALAKMDLDPTSNDIASTANSDIDGNVVLGTSRFYYGLDRNSGNNIDFVSTFAHELGHGLGFLSFIDRDTGAKPSVMTPQGDVLELDDAYMVHLIHRGAAPEDFPSMTDAQRLTALTSGPDLRWNGPLVKAASSRLTIGANPAGDVEIFAPNPFQPGSSLGHFSPTLSPDELMEPFATGPVHDVGLALELFQDLGWVTEAVTVGDGCAMMPGGDIGLGQAACEEDLPDNNESAAQTGLIGDTYSFSASAGAQISLRVDTTDPNVDPVLLLLDPNGNILAAGDDEVPCAVPLVCNFACPSITGTITAAGTYSVVVFDSTSLLCTGGRYEATADGTGGIMLLQDDEATGFVPARANRSNASFSSLSPFLAK